LVPDERRLCGLLDLEKRRRTVAGDRLLFVGVSNVASVRWCPMKAVLRSRAEELMFFAGYLTDRLVYARLLGLIRDLPHGDQDLLEAGGEVNVADLERLLRRLPVRPPPQPWAYQEVVGPGGEAAWALNPALSAAEQAHYHELASRAGLHVLDLEEDPKLRGLVLEELRAERYATVRWNFRWGPYIVVGVPDGITDDLSDELKTTRSRYLGSHLLPTALAQADLYGYFFNRPRKRVQLSVVEEDQTRSRPGTEFQAVDEGRRPSPRASAGSAASAMCGLIAQSARWGRPESQRVGGLARGNDALQSDVQLNKASPHSASSGRGISNRSASSITTAFRGPRAGLISWMRSPPEGPLPTRMGALHSLRHASLMYLLRPLKEPELPPRNGRRPRMAACRSFPPAAAITFSRALSRSRSPFLRSCRNSPSDQGFARHDWSLTARRAREVSSASGSKPR
jgi:hypothetical protein